VVNTSALHFVRAGCNLGSHTVCWETFVSLSLLSGILYENEVKLGHDRFLSHPFQFIINWSSTISATNRFKTQQFSRGEFAAQNPWRFYSSTSVFHFHHHYTNVPCSYFIYSAIFCSAHECKKVSVNYIHGVIFNNITLKVIFSIYMTVNSLSNIAETCCRLWILIKRCVRPSIIDVLLQNVSKIVRQTSKQFSSHHDKENLYSNLCPEVSGL
jgi:hypothetical protein